MKENGKSESHLRDTMQDASKNSQHFNKDKMALCFKNYIKNLPEDALDEISKAFVDKIVENENKMDVTYDDGASSIVKRFNLDSSNSKIMSREEESKLGLAASSQPTIVKLENSML